MQTTFSYDEKDNWIMDEVRQKAYLERKSKSAVIVAILEEYFAGGKRIGEILLRIGSLSQEELDKGLEIQGKKEESRRLGAILIQEGFVKERDLRRALALQSRSGALRDK